MNIALPEIIYLLHYLDMLLLTTDALRGSPF